MAVLIKTMYMPDTCRECELEREIWNQWTGSSTHECPLTDRDTDEFRRFSRHKLCPLIKVTDLTAEYLQALQNSRSEGDDED